MNCRKYYRDKEKYRLYRNGCNERYYRKTRNATNRYRRWTEEETRMIMKKDHSDTELARKLGRSVQAIQVKRAKMISGGFVYGEAIQE